MINGREGWIIRSVLDMEIGTTIQSERIDIRFFMNGAQHVLQFGPWTAGQYQTNQGGLTGDGTTSGTITRLSETSWKYRAGQIVSGGFGTTATPHIPSILGSTVSPTVLSSSVSDRPLLCRLHESGCHLGE